MNNPVNATDPMGLYVPLEPEAPFAGDVCVTFNCGHPYDPEGWVLPYPQLPPPRVRFPGLPVLSHILPGEDSLNWPLGPSPTEILRQILSANYSVFGVPTLEELMGRAWVMDAANNGLPTLPKVSDLVKKDYQAFTQCVGEPYGPAGKPPDWVSFLPTKLNPWTRQGGPDFGSNGPGMGPEPPTPQLPSPPTTELRIGKIRECMSKYPLAPLGGNTYLQPGDVF
jgi:hypothetical protein